MLITMLHVNRMRKHMVSQRHTSGKMSRKDAIQAAEKDDEPATTTDKPVVHILEPRRRLNNSDKPATTTTDEPVVQIQKGKNMLERGFLFKNEVFVKSRHDEILEAQKKLEEELAKKKEELAKKKEEKAKAKASPVSIESTIANEIRIAALGDDATSMDTTKFPWKPQLSVCTMSAEDVKRRYKTPENLSALLGELLVTKRKLYESIQREDAEQEAERRQYPNLAFDVQMTEATQEEQPKQKTKKKRKLVSNAQKKKTTQKQQPKPNPGVLYDTWLMNQSSDGGDDDGNDVFRMSDD